MNNKKDWSEEHLKDRFIEEQGWKRKYGLIIQTEMITDEFPEWFFPEEMESEVLSRGFRWQHEDHEEVVEDCDILDRVEDYSMINFEEWKKEFVKRELDEVKR